MANKKTNAKTNAQTTAQAANKNTLKCDNGVEVYENEIYMLCDDFIDTLPDPEMIYTNKRLISDMLIYIYKNYVCKILDNNHTNGNRYNIYTLDKLFDICSSICHRYNSNVNILLFCCMTNINRDTINRWKNNVERALTPDECGIVQKWYRGSELDLVQGGSVFDIFLLKSNFGYVETAPAKIETIQQIQTAAQLPQLGVIGSHNIIDADDPED